MRTAAVPGRTTFRRVSPSSMAGCGQPRVITAVRRTGRQELRGAGNQSADAFGPAQRLDRAVVRARGTARRILLALSAHRRPADLPGHLGPRHRRAQSLRTPPRAPDGPAQLSDGRAVQPVPRGHRPVSGRGPDVAARPGHRGAGRPQRRLPLPGHRHQPPAAAAARADRRAGLHPHVDRGLGPLRASRRRPRAVLHRPRGPRRHPRRRRPHRPLPGPRDGLQAHRPRLPPAAARPAEGEVAAGRPVVRGPGRRRLAALLPGRFPLLRRGAVHHPQPAGVRPALAGCRRPEDARLGPPRPGRPGARAGHPRRLARPLGGGGAAGRQCPDRARSERLHVLHGVRAARHPALGRHRPAPAGALVELAGPARPLRQRLRRSRRRRPGPDPAGLRGRLDGVCAALAGTRTRGRGRRRPPARTDEGPAHSAPEEGRPDPGPWPGPAATPEAGPPAAR